VLLIEHIFFAGVMYVKYAIPDYPKKLLELKETI
jgi:hypothetical protein